MFEKFNNNFVRERGDKNIIETYSRIAEVKNSNSDRLDLSFLELNSLPSELFQLHTIKYLDLKGNNIVSIPPEISKLQNLFELDISQNKIEALPLEFFELKQLKSIITIGNALKILPEYVCQLENLKYLVIAGSKISELPSTFSKLKKLELLSLYNNQFIEMPNLIDLPDIKEFVISGNPIRKFPEILNPQIQLLGLQNLNLKTLPNFIQKLKNLKTILMWENKLSEKNIPKWFWDIENLVEINLSQNNFTTIPTDIQRLHNLVRLDFSYNQIKKIPEYIGKLRNLSNFSITDNKLEKIPLTLCKLSNLKELYIGNNPICELPKEISNLNLDILDIASEWNLWNLDSYIKPPKEIIKKGLGFIKQYFIDLETQGEDFIFEAKIIIVGEPEAGKTSLARKLINPNVPLYVNEPMTVGIDKYKWEISQKTDWSANIWDFGGQDIMNSTHLYFLTKRSLYILLADSRKEDTHFFNWLNTIQVLGHNSPVLIVINEKSDNRKSIPDNLLEKFSCVKNISYVNLLDNRGLNELQETIIGNLKDLPHFGKEPFPCSWKYIRTVLEGYPKDYVTKEEYLLICKEFGLIDSKQALYICDFLHDIGVIVHFHADLLLREYVFLNTKWITDAFYKVIFDKAINNNFGNFSLNDLERIWDVETYPTEIHSALLKLMLNFEQCYEINRNTTFVVPLLLPNTTPKYTWNKESNLLYRVQYLFLPSSIISRLIVRLNSHIYNNLQWKNGLIISIDDTFAEIIEDKVMNMISIRIEGHAKRECLAVIRKEFYEIHKSFESIIYEEMLACICVECSISEKPFYHKYDVLKKYELKNKKNVTCEKSIEDVSVITLLTGVELPSESNKNITIENMNIYGGNTQFANELKNYNNLNLLTMPININTQHIYGGYQQFAETIVNNNPNIKFDDCDVPLLTFIAAHSKDNMEKQQLVNSVTVINDNKTEQQVKEEKKGLIRQFIDDHKKEIVGWAKMIGKTVLTIAATKYGLDLVALGISD